MPKTQTTKRRQATWVFIHGLAIVTALVIIQLLADFNQINFLLYIPPIGFALFILTLYVIQPIIIGAINVAFLHRLYSFEGWQISLWLNGLLLLLIFSSLNLLLELTLNLSFTLYLGIVEMLLLSYPFGYLGKLSNTDYRKRNSNT